MKKILKYIFLSLFTITIVACDNEDQELLVVSTQGSGQITAPSTGTAYVLNPLEEQTNPIFTLTWDSADYGNPTEIDYSIEFAKAGTDFADPYVAGETTNNLITWNILEFNGAVVTAGLSPFIEGELEIRVVSTVGATGVETQTSEPISVFVTPFTTDLPTIAVPGNHQGWDPATAPLLASSAFGETDYEGYVWLDGEYKFIAPDQTGSFFWGNTDWGDDGTFSGKLIDEDGEANANATVAGYYFVQANTTDLTYATTAVSWGIIGEATPTGWDADTDLVYDSETRILSVDIDLAPGGFKFRGNNEWGAFDLGTVNDDGNLVSGGDLTFEGASGNYHVVLDLSNPREYTYSITAN
ncbi:SusE domain-containing protein [Lutibacter sp. TH_r2]|uniref:SusE domain-containing protein n=1 Tax=Lutibacter sp. TH_r2 TaxID=3082083 RepID=UPI00295516AF|nr:SusE domain-containing protein [Lutibacter sp. TH_r2]MDV7188555.1 SusE domain-containing protein [Lutibacter sp. TH_r2]